MHPLMKCTDRQQTTNVSLSPRPTTRLRRTPPPKQQLITWPGLGTKPLVYPLLCPIVLTTLAHTNFRRSLFRSQSPTSCKASRCQSMAAGLKSAIGCSWKIMLAHYMQCLHVAELARPMSLAETMTAATLILSHRSAQR